MLPAVVEPRTGLSMGQSTELMAKRWQISRQDQDQLAYESHMKAAAAWREGFYDDLVVEYLGSEDRQQHPRRTPRSRSSRSCVRLSIRRAAP